MESLLSFLAMVGGLLVLGWLVGSDDERSKHAKPAQEPPLEQLPAQSRPFETR